MLEREILLHKVDHPRHLEVQQHAMSARLELVEQRIELRQLARVENELPQLRDLHRRERQLRRRRRGEDSLGGEAGEAGFEPVDVGLRILGRQTEEGGGEEGVEPLVLLIVDEGAVVADGVDGRGNDLVHVEPSVGLGEAGRRAVVLLDLAEGDKAESSPGVFEGEAGGLGGNVEREGSRGKSRGGIADPAEGRVRIVPGGAERFEDVRVVLVASTRRVDPVEGETNADDAV